MSDAMSQLRPLLRMARKHNASDLHLLAGLPPVVRINGEIIPARADTLTRESVAAIALGILNQRQRERFETDLELCVSLSDPEAGRFRVTVYYQAGVPELSIRMCSEIVPDAGALGLPPVVAELARRPSGLVLVTGRNGVGKTTTLNFMVDLINRERRAKIITIEDPVEFQHHHNRSIVVQQEVGTDVVSFPRALIHALRQNPDVIVIGEMRELESISTAVTAAETGHLVLATLHTPSALQAVERITGVFPPAQQRMVTMQFASCLQGILCQDLVPTADRKGRVLACEALLANDAVRTIIREDRTHTLGNVLATQRKQGMVSMDHCLLDLYQRGVISYDTAATRMRDPTQLNANRSPGTTTIRQDGA